jgi:hypothetical protein
MKVFCLYCFNDSAPAATVMARRGLDATAGRRDARRWQPARCLVRTGLPQLGPHLAAQEAA